MNKRLYDKFVFSPLFVTQDELIKPMTIFDMFRGLKMPVIINEVSRPVFTTSAAYLAYSVNNALKCQDEINCRVRMGEQADLALKHNIIPIHFNDGYNSETLYFDCEFCYDDFPITYNDYLKQYEIVKLKLL